MIKQQLSVIVINDRISVRPEKMVEFIQNQDDIYLIGVAGNVSQIQELTSSKQVDIVIFAGYQKNEENYEIVKNLTSHNNKPIVVMWAIPDEHIAFTCKEHEIRFQFDRQCPNEEFIDYLRTIARDYL